MLSKWYESGSKGDDRLRDAICMATTYGIPQTNMEQAEYGCRIQKSVKDQASRLIASMEAAQILRIMEEAPESYGYWLDFAYGDNQSLSRKDKCRFMLYLIRQQFINKKYVSKRIGNLDKLLGFILEEQAVRLRGNKPILDTERLKKVMGFGHVHWNNWRKIYTQALDWVAELDRKSMDYFIAYAPKFLR